MSKAIIIDNNPCCPKCKDNPLLGNLTGEYRQVSDENGESYTEFERFCNGGCYGKYKYYAQIGLDNTYRTILDKVTVLKDSKDKESKGDNDVDS